MPLTAMQLFQKFEVAYVGTCPWGARLIEPGKGIYIVSTSCSPDHNTGLSHSCTIAESALAIWLTNAPLMQINKTAPTIVNVEAELNRYWHESENILYIGKAQDQSISKRVSNFFNHKLGRPSPHKGGHWIMALSNLELLYVHYGICPHSPRKEFEMLKCFAENTSGIEFDEIDQPGNHIPFANKEIKYGGYFYRKKHSFTRSVYNKHIK